MRIALHRDVTPSALADPRAARLPTLIEEDEEPPSLVGGDPCPASPHPGFAAAAGSRLSSPPPPTPARPRLEVSRPERTLLRRRPLAARPRPARPPWLP